VPHRSILILSTHLRIGLPSGLFPSGFPTNMPALHENLKVSRPLATFLTLYRPRQFITTFTRARSHSIIAYRVRRIQRKPGLLGPQPSLEDSTRLHPVFASLHFATVILHFVISRVYFYRQEFILPRSEPKMKDHSLSAVRDSLFGISSTPGGRSLHPQPEDAPCRGDKGPLNIKRIIT
jgi:hypothetical protein